MAAAEDDARKIDAALEALESQRALLGDAIVAMAMQPLLEKRAALLDRTPPEQRLKTVTVLFADIVGSTTLSEHLDPEDVHDIIDRALARLTSLVEVRRGQVLQYAGDSLLAVFGAERVREDDAERAVRTGLAMLEEASRLADEIRAAHGLSGFDLRVGVNTGPVLLGGGVDAEGSIRGIAVNIAARMEQTAPVGRLRISHDTYRHVRGLFDIEAQAPMEVKGLSRAVRTYLVSNAHPRTFILPNRGIDGIDVDMVGRDAELEHLGKAFHTTASERALTWVTVVGEPGIGKSRLGMELVHWLELLPSSVCVFRGRPQAYGSNLPYGLLRDVLARRFEIQDSDSQATARDKLRRALAAQVADRADEFAALIGQLIGFDYGTDPHIAGIAAEGKQIRDRAFHALMDYVRALYQHDGAPLVFLLDDLHWADEGSLEFVDYLAKSADGLPLLIVGLARASLYERRPEWGSRHPRHTRLDLQPLSADGIRGLVEALLTRMGEVPEALNELLASSADGNPYFVEELVGMLIDDGVIVTDPERWHVVGDKLVAVKVPTTLAGVLQARLDALPAPAKAALLEASVVGHVFWEEALGRIAPDAPQELEGLMRRELVHSRDTSAFEGTREYAFKHHVLHQVAYESVLKATKREQHRFVADWLVSRCGDRQGEYFGTIADHYEKAGEIGHALHYLTKAAAAAADQYVNAAALDYLARALALVNPNDAAMRFELLRARCRVYAHTSQRHLQGGDIAALEALAEELDDDVRRARAASLRAAYALVTGDYPGTVAAATRSIALADAADAHGEALTAHLNLARARQFQGDHSLGTDALTEKALALARRVGDRRIESTSLAQLGVLAFHRGQYGIARERYQDALDIAKTIGDRAVESVVVNNLGETERTLGNYSSAIALFQIGRRLAREINQRSAGAYLLCNLAHVAYLSGNTVDSLEWSRQVGDIADDAKDLDLQATVLSTRGHIHAAMCQWENASACYRRSVEIYRQIGRQTMEAEPLAGLARVALARGLVPDAMATIAPVVANLDVGGSVEGTEDPMLIYLTCHQVLAASADPRADDFLRRGHELLMQRAKALGEADRLTFLENVPSHQAICAAWALRSSATR